MPVARHLAPDPEDAHVILLEELAGSRRVFPLLSYLLTPRPPPAKKVVSNLNRADVWTLANDNTTA